MTILRNTKNYLERKRIKNRVFTYGVFDIFHYGHLRVLKAAKRLGDELIIGVFTDKVAESFKRKPIVNQADRYRLIQELDLGKVVLLEALIPTEQFLQKHKIDIVAKGEGAGWGDTIPQFKTAKSVLLPYTKGISTSKIIKRL